MKEMKKEYIEPAMRLAELRHKHHLLFGSDGSHSKPGNLNYWDEPVKTYSGGDETINEDDVI